MILIITDAIDKSSNEVVDWLIHLNKKYICLNTSCLLSYHFVEISDSTLDVRIGLQDGTEQILDLTKVTSVWYRKGDIEIDFSYAISSLPSSLKRSLFDHLFSEWEGLKLFLFEYLSDKKILGNYYEEKKSKLNYLITAKECGLLIPDTYVINSKRDLLQLIDTKPNLITKSIGDIYNAIYDEKSLFTYTESIGYEDSIHLPGKFLPSLVQVNINKKYEVRVFFSGATMLAAAIFSQSAEGTKTDFRNTRSNTNRTVPYCLSEDIKRKLLLFIEKTKLTTGSIDLIVSSDNRLIFLEVNPSGQYGFIAYPCNYNISKSIAHML